VILTVIGSMLIAVGHIKNLMVRRSISSLRALSS
jgi:hypothetical protein